MEVKVTTKQLAVWNYLKNQTFGIKVNENWNIAQGLPNPEVRKTLAKIHSDTHGFLGKMNNLTKAEIRNAVFHKSEAHLYGSDQ